MGYCIEDVLYDSDFVDNLSKFMEEDASESFVCDYILDEVDRIANMSCPLESDSRFESYRDSFMGLLIRAAVGSRSDNKVSVGDVTLSVFDALNENGYGLNRLVSFKYVDDEDIIRTYEVSEIEK